MSDTKKYYWLKLKRDFFKRHDIKIIESMENGEKYLLFYLKLLVESLDHNGNLRFSDTIPYNEKMLSAITGTDIDIVRSAVKIFTELSMMEKMSDGTLYMSQVLTMTGDETAYAEKKRLYRERQKVDTVVDKKGTLSDKSIEYRDKSIELREEREEPAKPESIPAAEKPQSLNPNQENISERFETVRVKWNEQSKAEFRRLLINLRPEEREAVLTAFQFYTDDEIIEALNNYFGILASTLHDAFPYATLPNFLGKGLEQYTSGADPWAAKKKREKPERGKEPEKDTTPGRFDKYNALMKTE